jgi:hypothetical protein
VTEQLVLLRARAALEGLWALMNLCSLVNYVCIGRQTVGRHGTGLGWIRAGGKLDGRLAGQPSSGSCCNNSKLLQRRNDIETHLDAGSPPYAPRHSLHQRQVDKSSTNQRPTHLLGSATLKAGINGGCWFPAGQAAH